MYSVSNLYNTIIANSSHWFESRVLINGVAYGESTLMSVGTVYRVFSQEQPTVGGCLAAELEVKMLAPSSSIPRMAQVKPYVRVTDGTQTSEWIPQGIFFIDTRETSHNDDGLDVITLHCYDAMLKAEADYQDTSVGYPHTAGYVVRVIAKAMGLQSSTSVWDGVDSRTQELLTTTVYNVGLPIGFSMRETLGNIAAMYCGNWIINYDGQLRLVTLTELPDETYYLVDSSYDPITFGGDHIIV